MEGMLFFPICALGSYGFGDSLTSLAFVQPPLRHSAQRLPTYVIVYSYVSLPISYFTLKFLVFAIFRRFL